MKLLGIVFQSTQQPSKLILFNDVVNSIEEGTQRAVGAVVREHGELGWVPVITQLRDIPVIPSNIQTPTNKEPKITAANQSWLMKTILDNKDTVLFEASKKYFTKPETLYLEDKMK